MKVKKILETLFSFNIVLIGFGTIIIILLGFWIVLNESEYSLEEINMFVDTILKCLAVILGAVWFLNRYFAERKDVPKFEIQLDFESISLVSKRRMLIYRFDLLNKSNVLFKDYKYSLRIDGFSEKESKVICENLLRIPESNYNEGLPIEPNSWTAINNELIIDNKIVAVRFFYELNKIDKTIFTWHKTYKL
jgi:hypothetical protein